jgi:hypothetical protein
VLLTQKIKVLPGGDWVYPVSNMLSTSTYYDFEADFQSSFHAFSIPPFIHCHWFQDAGMAGKIKIFKLGYRTKGFSSS